MNFYDMLIGGVALLFSIIGIACLIALSYT